MNTFVQILIAAAGFGAGGEAMRQYRGFKARRRLRDYSERNSGFWTDRRIYGAEYAFMSFWLGGPWLMIVLAVNTNGVLAWTFLTMLGYPLGIYLLVYGLNAPVSNRASQRAARKQAMQDG